MYGSENILSLTHANSHMFPASMYPHASANDRYIQSLDSNTSLKACPCQMLERE